MMVALIAPRTRAVFFAELRGRVGSSSEKDAFVYVHGYKNTFEDAAKRAAQIHYDLKFKGAPIIYSWPSQGDYDDYSVDEQNARWSIPHLVAFLRDLEKNSGATKIHLLAHSMGGLVLTRALQRMGDELKGSPFHQIVLGAPDIDSDVFEDEIAPAILGTGRKLTLYASSNDFALAASRTLHENPRAGGSGARIVVVEGMDTLDVSSVSRGHSYIAGNGRVLSDLVRLLIENRKPSLAVGMLKGEWGKLTYWILKKQYQ